MTRTEGLLASTFASKQAVYEVVDGGGEPAIMVFAQTWPGEPDFA
jgi:hypothetical protein